MMMSNTEILNRKVEEAARQVKIHQALYSSSQEMRLKMEAELQYTKGRLHTLSRLYEQSLQEIFSLRQQLDAVQKALAELRTVII